VPRVLRHCFPLVLRRRRGLISPLFRSKPRKEERREKKRKREGEKKKKEKGIEKRRDEQRGCSSKRGPKSFFETLAFTTIGDGSKTDPDQRGKKEKKKKGRKEA